jgi:exopolyphosphatase/guanosine-5'-triphosphate,3'-diphosphate pyrophosphatase
MPENLILASLADGRRRRHIHPKRDIPADHCCPEARLTDIIPRWEWRTFGDRFGAADERFAELVAERVQESDETYLLSPANDANVKIRDALMDIKALVEVGTDGLEQWRPVMKATFPLTRDVARDVCAALGVALPASLGDAVTLEQLGAGLAEQGVRAVAVHKRRARYTIDGCTSELTDVVADKRRMRTVAIESEDAGRVLEAVSSMGLSAHENVSYPRGLKALLGMRRPGA